MKLSQLLAGIVPYHSTYNPEITGLALDSRQIKRGDLFFALPGKKTEGRFFIDEALKKGAAFVLVEGKQYNNASYANVVYLTDLIRHLPKIVSRFYDYPTNNLEIIGVTGTNGKTSCTHFLADALAKLNLRCALIGTLGCGFYEALTMSSLTTPDVLTLYHHFKDFLTKGAKYVAMEVSSHSLDQGRVQDLPFKIGIFTNLTRDHLDYHGNMEAYGRAKRKLFENASLQYAILNADDDFGQKLIKDFSSSKNVLSYGIQKSADIFAEVTQCNREGLRVKITSPWGNDFLNLALLGHFNVSNVLAVLGALCLLDIPFTSAISALSQVKTVRGRMQTFRGKTGPLAVVDYAHTPDALFQALKVLREHGKGKLFCLFGCGGDRDKGKRPLMAKIAELYADVVWVTDDNPRMEDHQRIVRDIMQGFSNPDRVVIQHNRLQAIQDLLHLAKDEDCVLIAGKGAETYQEIGKEKISFSDIKVVQEYFK